MFTPLEWGIAGRYLRSRREGFISLIAWLSLIGIALGVATLIIVMSVMNGFRAELIERILGIGGHVIVRAPDGPVSDYDALAAELAGARDVIRVAPIIEGQVMTLAGDRASGALVRGVRPGDLAANPLVAGGIVSGSLEAFTGGDAVVLGARLAGALGVFPGQQVTLVAPQTTTTPFGNVPRMKAYTVAATFDVGMYEYDSGLIFLPLEAAQVFFRMGGQGSAIGPRRRAPTSCGRARACASSTGVTPTRSSSARSRSNATSCS